MNIIKQIKDSDGNNIYPIGYAQGGMKMDLLWTNPSPTSVFAGQTISIDLSDYSIVCIVEYNGDSNYSSFVFPFNTSITYLMKGTFRGYFMRRTLTLSTSGVVFGDNYFNNDAGGAAGTVDNGYTIPYQIYGLKMSYIVPTSVHGLQYVEV